MAKRKRVAESSNTGIIHLPEAVLVEILSWIPILTLREKSIFVCKKWASIILHNPILLKRHALHGEPGLFLQVRRDKSKTRFFELKEGIKFKQRKYKIEFPGEIMGSSGGVALFYNYNYKTLHVANPFTGYVMQLPTPPAGSYGILSNIRVIPCSGNGIVKVVIPERGSKGKYYWGVLTVGVDISWRRIATTHQELTDYRLNNRKLISVGGVMYSKYQWLWNTDRRIHAINLRDETSHLFQIPKELGDGKSWLMEMGNHLCCIVQVPGRTVHNVWILKDLNQNIWVKLYTIDVNFEESIIINIGNSYLLEPIGWLDNNQSLVFGVRKSLCDTTFEIVAYNVTTKNKITCSRALPSYYEVQLHKNTLL